MRVGAPGLAAVAIALGMINVCAGFASSRGESLIRRANVARESASERRDGTSAAVSAAVSLIARWVNEVRPQVGPMIINGLPKSIVLVDPLSEFRRAPSPWADEFTIYDSQMPLSLIEPDEVVWLPLRFERACARLGLFFSNESDADAMRRWLLGETNEFPSVVGVRGFHDKCP